MQQLLALEAEALARVPETCSTSRQKTTTDDSSNCPVIRKYGRSDHPTGKKG